MEDESIEGGASEPADGGSNGQGAPDYKALYEQWRDKARKWEKQSKDNKAALDAAPSQEDLDAANAELELLRAEKARAQAVSEVAASTGLPESAVRSLSGATADELRASAEAVMASVQSYPASRDGGEPAPAKPTRDSILGIKDRNKRLDAIASNANLWR